MSDEAVLLVDDPVPLVRRLTLNRPNKRNALNDELRAVLFDALRAADRAGVRHQPFPFLHLDRLLERPI